MGIYRAAELATVLQRYRDGDLEWEAARWLVRSNALETLEFQANVATAVSPLAIADNDEPWNKLLVRFRSLGAMIASMDGDWGRKA
jgi:hypothetical protein